MQVESLIHRPNTTGVRIFLLQRQGFEPLILRPRFPAEVLDLASTLQVLC